MKSRLHRVIAVAAVLLGGSAAIASIDACTIINGLVVVTADAASGGDALTPDGGEGGVVDPCDHKRPQPRAATQTDGVDTATIVVVSEAISFGFGVEGGAPESVSFDLDNTCTTCPDGGLDSCKPNTAPPQRCDLGTRGEDNAGQELLSEAKSQGKLDLEKSANDSFASGGRAVLFVISGYNGMPDDPEVKVGVLVSPGLFDDAGVNLTPKHSTKDAWSVDDSTAVAGAQGVILPSVVKTGYVANNKLVVDQIDITLPIAQVANVTLRDAIFEGTVGPAPGGGFTLKDVTFAGRWSIAEATRVIGSFEAKTGEGPICDLAVQTTFNLVKSLICSAADLRAVPGNAADDRAKPCDALSIAVKSTLAPASLGALMNVSITESCTNAVNNCLPDGG